MPIKIKFNENEYITDTVIWDRDSYFVNVNNYWSRLVATIAQRVAENTTNNWGNFNQIRTQVIKLLGINPENGEIESSSPINLLPVNVLPSLLTSSLINFIKDKKYDDLNTILRIQINKSLEESKDFIKDSLNIEPLKSLKAIKVKHILVTNDSEENNKTFLKTADLETFFIETHTNTNKEQIEICSKKGTLFLTNNSFLHSSYLNRGVKNILLINNLTEITIEEITEEDTVTINIDGASKGNPGPSSIGILFQINNETVKEISEYIGEHTNNFAEYTALIRALEICLESGFYNIEVKSDSELVVKQINKVYKVKDPDIKDLYDKASVLINKLSTFKIVHVPREENSKADKLANQGLNTVNR